jgi:hypothetical protein
MNHRTNKVVTLITGLLLALAMSTAHANPSNKWRLEFSGNAESDGVIVIQITPKGGEPIELSTDVKDGTGENAVAKTVVNSLKDQLPKSAYKVERDDGEDVLIKRRSNTPAFDVAITSNTVKGVRIHPERE